MNTVEISQDDDAMNPRTDFDNFGTMVCWHRRYELGDDQPSSSPSDYENSLPKDVIKLPLYLYDHSGITMKTTPFSCPWDSGQVGFIFVTLENVRKEFGVKRVSKNIRTKCEDILRSEVATYDSYISGDVWIVAEKAASGIVLYACGGFYGYDSAKEEAERIESGFKTE